MRRARSQSWRFAHDVDQMLHALLYIRDALGLEVEQRGGVGPRLAGDVPDRSSLLDPDARQEVARDWQAWWSNAVAAQAATQLEGPGGGTQERMRRIGERRRLVADPPEWSTLSGHPALQQAARSLYVEGCQWSNSAARPFLPPACRDVFKWDLVRDVAEATAAEHGVSVGVINGCGLVLLVEGNWWELVSPGVVLCSVAAATKPASTLAILHEAFSSPLAA